MGYSIQFSIGAQGTDSNKLDGRHWSVKNKRRKSHKREIAEKAKGFGPHKPLEFFNLYITRHCPARNFLDYDNMVHSFKGIVDGLKNSGIIKGDSWRYITRNNYYPDQQKSEEIKIVIRVESAIKEDE